MFRQVMNFPFICVITPSPLYPLILPTAICILLLCPESRPSFVRSIYSMLAVEQKINNQMFHSFYLLSFGQRDFGIRKRSHADGKNCHCYGADGIRSRRTKRPVRGAGCHRMSDAIRVFRRPLLTEKRSDSASKLSR